MFKSVHAQTINPCDPQMRVVTITPLVWIRLDRRRRVRANQIYRLLIEHQFFGSLRNKPFLCVL